MGMQVRLPGLERSEAIGIIWREVGPLMQGKTPHEAERMADALIKAATVPDYFNKELPYINVRTLTNALEQIKAAAQQEKVEAVA